MQFKLFYIITSVLFLSSCISITSSSHSSNDDAPNAYIKSKNNTTEETVIVPLFASDKPVVINACIGDELDFTIMIDGIEQEVISSNLMMYILSSEIAIDKLPSNFQYTIPQVQPGIYPVVVSGKFCIGEVDDKGSNQSSALVIHEIPEEVYTRISVLEKMDD